MSEEITKSDTGDSEMRRKPDGIKGFYVYFVEGTCFDCGAEDRTILGWYRGEPDRDTLTRIAKSYVRNKVIPYNEDQLTVTDWSIFAANGYAKTLYCTEKFTLKEIE